MKFQTVLLSLCVLATAGGIYLNWALSDRHKELGFVCGYSYARRLPLVPECAAIKERAVIRHRSLQ